MGRCRHMADGFSHPLFHLANSFFQLCSVDSGPTTMNGPDTSCSFRCATSATDCTVLPSPISSPRIPLSPFS